MDTYFWIVLNLGGELSEFGPYLTFKDAATMMMDHPEPLISGRQRGKYKLTIEERCLHDGEWELLAVKTTERGFHNGSSNDL